MCATCTSSTASGRAIRHMLRSNETLPSSESVCVWFKASTSVYHHESNAETYWVEKWQALEKPQRYRWRTPKLHTQSVATNRTLYVVIIPRCARRQRSACKARAAEKTRRLTGVHPLLYTVGRRSRMRRMSSAPVTKTTVLPAMVSSKSPPNSSAHASSCWLICPKRNEQIEHRIRHDSCKGITRRISANKS